MQEEARAVVGAAALGGAAGLDVVALLRELVGRSPSPGTPRRSGTRWGPSSTSCAEQAPHLEVTRAETPTTPGPCCGPPTDPDRPQLLLACHVDTVPVPDAGEWQRDPFGADLDGGRVWGRGGSDMKAGLVASVAALAAADPETPVALLLTSDEEIGSKGAAAAASAVAEQRIGAVVVPEATGNQVVLGHKGALWLAVRTAGRAAHGSTPERGHNAVLDLAALLTRAGGEIPLRTDEFLGTETWNPGVVTGGTVPNVVPDRAEAVIDMRTVADGGELLRWWQGQPEVADVEVRVDLPPVGTPADDPWVATLPGPVLPTAGDLLHRRVRAGRGGAGGADRRLGPRHAGGDARPRRVRGARRARAGGRGVRRRRRPLGRLTVARDHTVGADEVDTPAYPIQSCIVTIVERPRRRRAETVERLLDAALETFAEIGFAAGQRRGHLLPRRLHPRRLLLQLPHQGRAVRRPVRPRDRAQPGPGRGAADRHRGRGRPGRAAVERCLSTFRADRTWVLVHTEYALYATRHPEAAAALRRHAEELHRRLTALIEAAAARTGIRLTVPPNRLARIVLALHDGVVIREVLGGPTAPGSAGDRAASDLERTAFLLLAPRRHHPPDLESFFP